MEGRRKRRRRGEREKERKKKRARSKEIPYGTRDGKTDENDQKSAHAVRRAEAAE